MINAESFVNEIIGKIRENGFFDDKKVIHAFPDIQKPVILKKAVIAVGLKEISVDDSSIGQASKAGNISVSADVFIPFSLHGCSTEKIVCEICRSVSAYGISAVKISACCADSYSQCFVVKAVFTFNDEIVFGGDTDE